jgi:hypothetical protein
MDLRSISLLLEIVRMPSMNGCDEYTEGLQQAGGVS